MKFKNKLKVCMVGHNPPFQGGIVQYCVLLVNHLKKNVDLKVIGFKKLYPPLFYKGKLPKKNKSKINFEVPSYNLITWYNPLTWINVFLKARKSDIIFMHWVSPLLAPLQFLILGLNKLMTKRKVVLTCHNIEPHEQTIFDKIFTKSVFSLVDHFVVHAKQNKIRLMKDYNKKDDRVHVIPHGTFDYFTKWKKESQKELKKIFSIDQNKKVILFFGYIREYKGLRYLLKSMSKILQHNKNVHLLIAGELWQNIKDYKNDLKLIKNSITFFPHYVLDNQVYKFFDTADILVLPYHNTEQTISGPLLVGLAFGKPIIISPVGGIKEFIKDGENAIFSDGGDVNQLTDRIEMLLKNSKLQKKLGEKALKTNSLFKWENVAKSYEEVFNKAVKRK